MKVVKNVFLSLLTLMCFFVVGCSVNTAAVTPEENTYTAVQVPADATAVKTLATKPENNDLTEFTPQQKTIVANTNVATIELKSITYDELWCGWNVNCLFTNNHSDSLVFSVEKLTVNDYVIRHPFATEISKSSKSNEAVFIPDYELAGYNIRTMSSIAIQFNITDTLDKVFEPEYVFTSELIEILNPVETLPNSTPKDDTLVISTKIIEQVVFNYNGIIVSTTGEIEEKGAFGPEIKIIVESDNPNLVLETYEVLVNNYKIDSNIGVETSQGSVIESSIKLLSSSLQNNNITNIETIEVVFYLIDLDAPAVNRYYTSEKIDLSQSAQKDIETTEPELPEVIEPEIPQPEEPQKPVEPEKPTEPVLPNAPETTEPENTVPEVPVEPEVEDPVYGSITSDFHLRMEGFTTFSKINLIDYTKKPGYIWEGFVFVYKDINGNEVRTEKLMITGVPVEVTDLWPEDRNVHIEAHYFKLPQMIDLVTNGGLCKIDVYQYYEAAPAELPVPTRDGYIFMGWTANNNYAEMDFIQHSDEDWEDITRLYAVWSSEGYEDFTYKLYKDCWIVTNYTGYGDNFETPKVYMNIEVKTFYSASYLIIENGLLYNSAEENSLIIAPTSDDIFEIVNSEFGYLIVFNTGTVLDLNNSWEMFNKRSNKLVYDAENKVFKIYSRNNTLEYEFYIEGLL